MPASMPMAIRRWTGPASLAAAGIRTDTTSALVQGERLLSRRRLQWDHPALQQARPRHRDGDRPEQRLKAVFQDSAPVRPGLLRWLPATRRPAASRRTPPAAWAIRCRCSSGALRSFIRLGSLSGPGFASTEIAMLPLRRYTHGARYGRRWRSR